MALSSCTPGSTADIQQRLVKWCLGTERGLARVEYMADQSREAVNNHLKAQLSNQNIAFHEIKLPVDSAATQLLHFLRERLEACSSGVVSITGFSTAFIREDHLSGLNFNREQWASFPLRQVWWFTPEFSQLSEEEMPDLNSWFILRLRLLEVPEQTYVPRVEIVSLSVVKEKDAKRRADYLVTRFNQAEQRNADPVNNLELFGLPALQALMDSGNHEEGRRFNQQLEPQLNAVLAAKETSLLIAWAEIYERLGEFEKAKALYQHLIEIFDEVLRIEPGDVGAHDNKGNALASLGDLQAGRSDFSNAISSYQSAIAAYDQALAVAPDLVAAHNNKGNALLSLGDLWLGRSDVGNSLISYQQAIAAYDQALALAPNYVNAYSNKGTALRSLGDLQTDLEQISEALTSYQAAINSYDRALQLAPNYPLALRNQGQAHERLGLLLEKNGEPDQGMAQYRLAITVYAHLLDLVPGDEKTRQRRDGLVALIP